VRVTRLTGDVTYGVHVLTMFSYSIELAVAEVICALLWIRLLYFVTTADIATCTCTMYMYRPASSHTHTHTLSRIHIHTYNIPQGGISN
jgi:hypothetical protein